MIALSKTADPADFADLAKELQVVDQHFAKDSPQHEMRRWEYALALRAYEQWCFSGAHGRGLPNGPIYDIGGAGSPFFRMLDPYAVISVDPLDMHRKDLATYLKECPKLGSAVFCLSVLEHVDDLEQFAYHLSCLTAPGGLLFLTMDCCDHQRHALDVEDPHHFSWMRDRIFRWTPDLDPDFSGYRQHVLYLPDVAALIARFAQHSLVRFGDLDPVYHGPQVYDYTFASLCLQKRS